MARTKKPKPESDSAALPTRPHPISHFGGSDSEAWNRLIGTQVLDTLSTSSRTDEKSQRDGIGIYQALQNIKPRNEIEGMMVAQLIAAHNATMECYARAMIEGQTMISRRENLNAASKLSRTFTTLLETLNRYRGKGQQKVTVEHVHIHSGAQAVVGVVETRGVGVQAKNEEQPHAQQITDAQQPPLWSNDAPEDPVPVPGDEERPLPDARRKGNRRANG
jgi:hypothetical protein